MLSEGKQMLPVQRLLDVVVDLEDFLAEMWVWPAGQALWFPLCS